MPRRKINSKELMQLRSSGVKILDAGTGKPFDFSELDREQKERKRLDFYDGLTKKINEITVIKAEDIKSVSRETNEQYQKVSSLIKDLHESLVQLASVSKGIQEDSDHKFTLAIQAMEKTIVSMSDAITEVLKPNKTRIVNLRVPIKRNNYNVAESFDIVGTIEEK